MRSASSSAIARPRPLPRARRPERGRSARRRAPSSSAGIPGPLSRHLELRAPSASLGHDVSVEPAGVWRSALSTSTRSTCSTRPSSPSASALARPRQRRTCDPRRGASACISRAQSSASSPRSSSSLRDRDPAGVEAREVEQVGRELRQPLTCSRIVARNSPRSAGSAPRSVAQLEEAAERRQRRAELVRGVRDERRARALERLEPDAHLIERACQLGDLVVRLVDDRLGERAVRDAIGAARSRREPAGQR